MSGKVFVRESVGEDENRYMRGDLGEGPDPGAEPRAFVAGESEFVWRARGEFLEAFFRESTLERTRNPGGRARDSSSRGTQVSSSS